MNTPIPILCQQPRRATRRWHLPVTSRVVMAMLVCIPLALSVWSGAVQAGSRSLPPDATPLAALGERLCTTRGDYCAAVLAAGLALDSPFNVLISELCLHVRYFEDELAGIRCLVDGIAGVAALPPSVLARGRTASGRVGAPAQAERHWSARVRLYFARIPAHCDRSTPVIYDYFDCLREGVLFYEALMRAFRQA